MSQIANASTATAPAIVAPKCPAQATTTVPAMAATSPATPGTRNLPVPKVVHSAHGVHKGPVVHQGQCRTQNDRRKDVCAVDDPGGKHGHHDEHLAKRCHVVLSVSRRSNGGIMPICWKRSRRLSSSQCSTNS